MKHKPLEMNILILSASFLRHIPKPHSSKLMTVIQSPGVQLVLNLLKLQLGYTCDLFTPRVHLEKQICASLEFHVDDPSKSSITYGIIIGNPPRCSWRIRHNHHEIQCPDGHLGY
jgi:hypothetical protein